MNEHIEVNPELVPVIDGTDVTLAPAATREGEAASEETTIFIAEDAETV